MYGATHVSTSVLSELTRWALPRLVLYMATAVTAGVLFVFGAWLYASFFAEPKPMPVLIEPIELPKAKPVAPGVGPMRTNPADLMVWRKGSADSAPIAASNIFGAEIFSANNEYVGKVTEIVMDRRGATSAVIIGLEGNWRTKKQVLIPFSSVSWMAGDTRMEKGYVKFTFKDLQNLPVGNHPLLRDK